MIGCRIFTRSCLFKLILAASIGPLAIGAKPALAQSNRSSGAIERTIPKQQPATRVAPTISAPTPIVPAGSAVTGRFILGAVHIEGATAFSQAELSPLFEPYLATEVDESTLNEIAARITDRYRKAGYLLSYAMVPAQDVRAGIVRIAVVEGLVDTIRIEGAGNGLSTVEAIAAPLLKDVPLRDRTLERAIGLVRDLPGFTVVDASLTRSDADARRHALKIVVARDPIRALAYTDNRVTDENGRIRLYSSASLASLAMTGDDLRVDLFAIPGNHYRYVYGQLAASVPLGHDGLRFAASASAGKQDQRISGHDFDDSSTNFAALLSYPVLRSRALTMVAKVSINDWRSTGETGGTRIQRDRLRVARIGVDLSNESRTRLSGEFSLSRGLGFDGMTEKGDLLASRPDASGRFTKAAFTLQLTQPISEKFTLQALMAGQYSDRPVLSVEEFALGGNRLGRAFDFNAITGDRGLGGGVELAYRLGDLKRGPQGIQVFGFADGGAAFQAGSPAGVRRKNSLMSAGLGSRFTLAGVAISFEAGVPIEYQGKNKSVRAFLSAYRAF